MRLLFPLCWRPSSGQNMRLLSSVLALAFVCMLQHDGLGQEGDLLEDTPIAETSDADMSVPDTSAPTGGASDSDEEKTRTALDTILDGGIVGFLIIILSMISVGFIVEHSMSIRKSVLMPDAALNEVDELVEAGKIDEAIDACAAPENNCMATLVMLAGLERYQSSEFGFAEYKAAVEEAGEDQTGQLYRKTEVLGLIGSISPMLGLTGTVLGMIEAFNAIAASGGMARPDELAGGIGQALVTTLLGLVVAIPTMIAFSYFRNKIDSIVAEAGKRIEQILMPLGRRKG